MKIELVKFENDSLVLVKNVELSFVPEKEQCFIDADTEIWYYVTGSYFSDNRTVAVVKEVEQISERRILLGIGNYLKR